MKIRSIREERTMLPAGSQGAIEVLVHPEWAWRWPHLVQGTTTRATDFRPDGGQTPWHRLAAASRCGSVVHSRQPHRARVDVRTRAAPGFTLAPPADGHLTRDPGVLLGITVADCVPITVHAPGFGVVGAVHAGWRSAAGGILERALARLRDSFGVRPDSLELHLGPSICGDCYEVGPEVFEALGLDVPGGPTPIDLPAAVAARAVAAGVGAERITRSEWCTRCSESTLWSHRGGDAGRQVGFVGLRRPGGIATETPEGQG